MMRKLTTPQAILFGLLMIALAIVSIPYTSNSLVYKISICDEFGDCAYVYKDGLKIYIH